MEPLSQQAARVGALLMLSALTAHAMPGHALALLTPAVLVAATELLFLVDGPWAAPLQRRVAVRVARR